MSNELIKDEKYQSIVDEIKQAICEGIHNSRWELVKTYWGVGKTIREDLLHDRGVNITAQIAKLEEDTGIKHSTLWSAVQCFDKYPKLDDIPEGKNISWNKIKTKYLPHPKLEAKKKTKKDDLLESNAKPEKVKIVHDACPHCIDGKPACEYQKALLMAMKKSVKKSGSESPIMKFNFLRVSDRYCQLFYDKMGTETSFTNWAAFNSQLAKKIHVRTEDEIYNGLSNYFKDKWIEEHTKFDALGFVKNLDKYCLVKKSVKQDYEDMSPLRDKK